MCCVRLVVDCVYVMLAINCSVIYSGFVMLVWVLKLARCVSVEQQKYSESGS